MSFSELLNKKICNTINFLLIRKTYSINDYRKEKSYETEK